MRLDDLGARLRASLGGVARFGQAFPSAAAEAASRTRNLLRTVSILAELLEGGITIPREPESPEGGDSPRVISLVQLDGDMVTRICCQAFDLGPDRLGALLTTHFDQVDAVLRPLRHLKSVVLALRGLFAVVGLGLEIQPAQHLVTALLAGEAKGIRESVSMFAWEIGLGLAALIFSYLVPWILKLLIRWKAGQLFIWPSVLRSQPGPTE